MSKVQAIAMVKMTRAIPAIVMETMRATLSMVVVVVGERKQLVTLSGLIGTWCVIIVIRDIAN